MFINSIWLFMIILVIVIAVYNNRMMEIIEVLFEVVKNVVILVIGLVGSMVLWLGII